ncbi:MAG: DUF4249 domain-containing protein [Bacteroidales bacterium]|nr:DUF4249 domain-containing protein [Bacteroidales bacterium]
MKPWVNCVLLLFTGCIACVSDYKLDYPLSEKVPVVNGFIYADSALMLNLSWSAHPDSNHYKGIEHANITLKEDNKHIELLFEENGRYYFNGIAKENSKYSLELDIEADQPITSNTLVPRAPAYTYRIISDRCNNNMLELVLPPVKNDRGAIYLMAFKYEKNDDTWVQIDLYSNTVLSDPFNRVFDTTSFGCMAYVYDYFMRIPTNHITNTAQTVELSSFLFSGNIKFNILTVTEEFDRYFKAGYLQRSFDPETNIPFSCEPIILPSNIQGALGVFAACQITSLDIQFN